MKVVFEIYAQFPSVWKNGKMIKDWHEVLIYRNDNRLEAYEALRKLRTKKHTIIREVLSCSARRADELLGARFFDMRWVDEDNVPENDPLA